MQRLTPEIIVNWPEFTSERPFRVLTSGCLLGQLCGVDGSSNGEYPWMKKLAQLPNVQAVSFCPEEFSFGVPRNLPDIHGGNGFDVLDGRAKVLDDKMNDITHGMIVAGQRMLEIAQEHSVHLAILMDMSAACGSQVISDGCRLVDQRKYQRGPGVASAILMRAGFKVISQRDFKSLEAIYKKLNPQHVINHDAKDHHETDWYREYFKVEC